MFSIYIKWYQIIGNILILYLHILVFIYFSSLDELNQSKTRTNVNKGRQLSQHYLIIQISSYATCITHT